MVTFNPNRYANAVMPDVPVFTQKQLDAAVAAERERCAQIAEAATKEQRDAIKHLCDGGVCECWIAKKIREEIS